MGHGALTERGEKYKALVIKKDTARHGTYRLDKIIMRGNVMIRIGFIWLTRGTRCEF